MLLATPGTSIPGPLTGPLVGDHPEGFECHAD